MILLLSGEGPTDLGSDVNGTFRPGPMAYIIDALLKEKLNYSFLQDARLSIEYRSRKYLVEQEPKQSSGKRMELRGKDKPPGVKYYYKNARALARMAKTMQRDNKTPVLAVLFRDVDSTHSSAQDEWEEKWDSMIAGFKSEGYPHGIPMIPDRKSEAWLLCCTDEAV